MAAPAESDDPRHSRIPASDIDLDHVAVAVEHHTDVWPRYIAELAGQWVSGGEAIGFAAAQIRYANGMKLEVLEPANVEHNDFLRRFLDRNGPGPHHLTYKVRDIYAGLAAAEAAGYRPVNAQLDNPDWKEAFLHPKDAPGVVVQLAQASGDWQSPPPPALPSPPAGRKPAALLHVAHAVSSMDEGLRLFEGLLSGQRVDAGEDQSDQTRWVELGWKGPGRVRLVEPTGPTSPVAAWLEGRPGRVLYLAFETDSAGTVDPSENKGTRLRLVSR
jgi:catechol 2,3-dioxygenase-like lactoylglutathione lyase family enzyme